MSILEQYVCTTPFNYLEIHNNTVKGCCPSWMPIIYGTTDKLDEIWNGEVATNVRKSVLDGSYSYCDKNKCPHLSQLINFENPTEVFQRKDNFNINNEGPTRLNFAFDMSCNLSCPSCRKEIIISNNEELDLYNNIMKNLSLAFKDTVTTLYMSGSCDPFVSKTFRNLLMNFNVNLFPKLKNIHIHTNGLLLDEEMWNKIQKSHKYIKTIEVSVDAATKETYEKIRRGGNWDKLVDNLNFISSIPTIVTKHYSFVAQDTNYKEMEMFYDFIHNLPHFNRRYNVYYGKILNWGTYSDEEYFKKQVWNEIHPNFNDFKDEFSKICIKYDSTNNMNDIIKKYKLRPKLNRFI